LNLNSQLNQHFTSISKTETMRLSDYLKGQMRMSHIYQPVMIWTLLDKGGNASIREIAREIAGYDEAMLEYYEERVKNMVGKVLARNKIASRALSDKQSFELTALYSQDEIEDLKGLCERKISEFIERRNIDIWDHRRNARRPVPGSVRYEVLVKAHHKCELCGVDASVRALEVDHIVPKSLGGPDSLDNYQALCYKCNTNKGNRSDIDLRSLSEDYVSYGECIFCNHSDVVEENELAKAFYDKYPVTRGHILIVPKRHVKGYFDLFQPELNAINRLMRSVRERLMSEDISITGFTVGTNDGEAAGQTVMHSHLHLIPRRVNDMDDARGGVRGVIPERQKY
jgi:ATP adenylyltransferase